MTVASSQRTAHDLRLEEQRHLDGKDDNEAEHLTSGGDLGLVAHVVVGRACPVVEVVDGSGQLCAGQESTNHKCDECNYVEDEDNVATLVRLGHQKQDHEQEYAHADLDSVDDGRLDSKIQKSLYA